MTTSFENSRGPYDELPKHMSSLTWFRPGLNSLSNSVAHRSKRHCNLCWDTSLVKSVRITTWMSSRLFAGRSHDVGANSGQSHHTSSPMRYFHSDPSLHCSVSSSLVSSTLRDVFLSILTYYALTSFSQVTLHRVRELFTRGRIE